MKWHALLLLIRPANVITAIADVLAGIAISGILLHATNIEIIYPKMVYLIVATIGLYGGGIVFNDIFDLDSDHIHRPERVLPSGKISKNQAIAFGVVLLILGITCAFLCTPLSGFIAINIALCALIYDKWAKHHQILGPLFMGACRGLNLILGMTIIAPLNPKFFFIGLLPLIFIAAITLTAQKESKGNNKKSIYLAMLLDFSIVIGFVLLWKYFDFSFTKGFIFIAFWYGMNLLAKWRAIRVNTPQNIMRAVKIGILSLIPLNASYTAGFSHIIFAIIVLSLLPLSLYLSKKFPVT